MKRLSILAAGLLIGAAALQFSSVASGQDGWVTLLDTTKMGDWTEVGKANWAMKDGALTADKLDGKDLVLSRQQELLQGFPDQGRVLDRRGRQQRHLHPLRPVGDKIDAKICYEVNIFDKRPDPSYGTGAIVDVAKVDPMPKAGRQVEYLRDHRAGLASRRRAQRPEDRRRAGLQAHAERTVRPAIRLGRGQVPQGADQAAVEARARTRRSAALTAMRCEPGPSRRSSVIVTVLASRDGEAEACTQNQRPETSLAGSRRPHPLSAGEPSGARPRRSG